MIIEIRTQRNKPGRGVSFRVVSRIVSHAGWDKRVEDERGFGRGEPNPVFREGFSRGIVRIFRRGGLFL